MKPIQLLLLVALFFSACKKTKDRRYGETIQISCKIDGIEFAQIVKEDEPVHTEILIASAQGIIVETRGPMFRIKEDLHIGFSLGFYKKDTASQGTDFQPIEQLLTVGNKPFKYFNAGNPVTTPGVEITFRNTYYETWSSSPIDLATRQGKQPTTEQEGSTFQITEAKKASATEYILKGTFNCNLFKWQTGEKRVLTEGKFTCIITTN